MFPQKSTSHQQLFTEAITIIVPDRENVQGRKMAGMHRSSKYILC